MFKQQTQNRR